MTNLSRGLSCLALAVSSIACPHHSAAQGQTDTLVAAAALPDAPQAQQGSTSSSPAGSAPPRGLLAPRYFRLVEPGQKVAPLSSGGKMVFALRESVNPVVIVTSLYSAGYEQITGDDPKYGNDSGAFAAKFGASMLRSTTVRLFADGVFAPVFHQDPRYYRVATGNIFVRGLRSAEQAVVRRGDDGEQEFNASGLVGRAASAALTLAYYPPASRKAGVVLSTFGVSVATDAGGDLVLEFLPDLARKFPILKKFEIQ